MDLPFISHWTPEAISIAATFASLGVLFHLSILPREIDYSLAILSISFLTTWLGLVTIFTTQFNLSFVTAVLRASFAGVSFLTALAISIVIYRLYLHPLRAFPGSWGAKISRLYVFALVRRTGGKYHFELERLHRQFGDFVRTGLAFFHS